MKLLWMMLLVVALASPGVCTTPAPSEQHSPKVAQELAYVADYAQKQEAQIVARLAQETNALRKLQLEYMLRQDYGNRLARERDKAVQGEQFTSPKIEQLRAKREVLLKELEALRKAIREAGYETAGARAIETLMDTNNSQVDAMRNVLWPKTGSAPSTPTTPIDQKAEEVQ